MSRTEEEDSRYQLAQISKPIKTQQTERYPKSPEGRKIPIKQALKPVRRVGDQSDMVPTNITPVRQASVEMPPGKHLLDGVNSRLSEQRAETKAQLPPLNKRESQLSTFAKPSKQSDVFVRL